MSWLKKMDKNYTKKLKNKRIIAISYSDDNMTMSRSLNLITAKIIGRADSVIGYSPNDLGADFVEANKDILSYSRGAGYWIWKPYIMLKTLDKMSEGEYLIYTDAGMIYVDRIRTLIRQMERDNQDIFLSYGFAPCKDWTKRDAFILMDCDTDDAHNSIMVSGGYVIVRKTDSSVSFIKEWQRYCNDIRIVSDEPNRCNKPNLSGFVENRHDQSILSLLAYKYKIEPYKAVSRVDEPQAHRNVLFSRIPGVYGYTFNHTLELIVREHQTSGYMRSDYGRIFINTGLRNMSNIKYIKNLIKRIAEAKKADKWGRKNNDIYIEKEKERLRKLKEFSEGSV